MDSGARGRSLAVARARAWVSPRRGAPLLVTLIALTSCTVQAPTDAEPEAPSPPRPTSWALSLKVIESDRIAVAGGSVSAYEQSIEVVVHADATQPADRCFVQADVSGQGGPDNRVGEKVPTSVGEVPALRNGAGAEGPYLMWQDANRRWITVQCDHEATMAEVAETVRPDRGSSLTLPFGLDPPDEYAVSSVHVTRDPLEVGVLIDRVSRPDSDSLEVTAGGPTQAETPSGDPTTVGDRPGVVSKDPRSPRVCVATDQAAYVCVGVPSDDTGPYPDRSDDLPVIVAIAACLRFADLDDPATWFDADQALR